MRAGLRLCPVGSLDCLNIVYCYCFSLLQQLYFIITLFCVCCVGKLGIKRYTIIYNIYLPPIIILFIYFISIHLIENSYFIIIIIFNLSKLFKHLLQLNNGFFSFYYTLKPYKVFYDTHIVFDWSCKLTLYYLECIVLCLLYKLTLCND